MLSRFFFLILNIKILTFKLLLKSHKYGYVERKNSHRKITQHPKTILQLKNNLICKICKKILEQLKLQNVRRRSLSCAIVNKLRLRIWHNNMKITMHKENDDIFHLPREIARAGYSTMSLRIRIQPHFPWLVYGITVRHHNG